MKKNKFLIRYLLLHLVLLLARQPSTCNIRILDNFNPPSFPLCAFMSSVPLSFEKNKSLLQKSHLSGSDVLQNIFILIHLLIKKQSLFPKLPKIGFLLCICRLHLHFLLFTLFDFGRFTCSCVYLKIFEFITSLHIHLHKLKDVPNGCF